MPICTSIFSDGFLSQVQVVLFLIVKIPLSFMIVMLGSISFGATTLIDSIVSCVRITFTSSNKFIRWNEPASRFIVTMGPASSKQPGFLQAWNEKIIDNKIINDLFTYLNL